MSSKTRDGLKDSPSHSSEMAKTVAAMLPRSAIAYLDGSIPPYHQCQAIKRDARDSELKSAKRGLSQSGPC